MLRGWSIPAAGLFLVSALTLLYELVQTRIFSYSLHPLIAYSAIAIAMLGFGIGATALTLRPALAGQEPMRRLAQLSLGLALSIVLVNVLFARVSANVIPIKTLPVSPGWTSVALLPCVIPYVLAGMLVTLILQSGLGRVGRLYFWNLAGSALGCALVMVLLRPLGAERLVAICAACAAAAAALFAWNERGRLRFVSGAFALIIAASAPFAPSWIAFQPDSNDLLYVYAVQHGARLEREFSQWDPVGRIEVLRHDQPHLFVTEPVSYRTITNDSGAMALLIQAGDPGWGKEIFEQSVYATPYLLKDRPEVLVIGVGGGVDIHTALHWNAKRVTGVEVSATTLHILTGPYARFTRWAERGEQVRLVHGDGRAFARNTRDRFDIVQMSGVDTFTMHSASAMVTAEDYLYTIDAFEDFLGLLKPEGVLAVTRFGDEAMNLSTLAAAALRRIGVTEPHHHIFAVQQSEASGIVVKRTPFVADELSRLRKIGERTVPNGVRVPHYDAVGLRASDPVRVLYPSANGQEPRYSHFFSQMAEAHEVQALRKYNNAFVPPTDDRPYYMLLGIWMASARIIHPVVGTLRVATLIIAGTSLILILAPLLVMRRRSKAKLGTMAAVVGYFFALGFGFMLLEVALIHRTLVFVGSPAASVSVVITSILLASSLGAYASDRVTWSWMRRLGFAVGGMLLVGALFRFGAEPLFDKLFVLPVWGRWIAAAAALAPGGFFAGWFFPVGLRVIGTRSEALVPWAIAVNGFASVMGSLATLSLGVSFGFGTVFVVGLCAYVFAFAVLAPMARHAPE